MQYNETLNLEYLEWMIDVVCGDSVCSSYPYHSLFTILHSTQFRYVDYIPLDSNRESDAYELRTRFEDEFGYDDDSIAQPCSVLEVMVALSIRIEEDIMGNSVYGDRAPQWFWSMIASLGLADQTDKNLDVGKCNYILQRFLNREYEPNGEGGLFTLTHPDCDLTTIEIWWQANRFCNEQLELTN